MNGHRYNEFGFVENDSNSTAITPFGGFSNHRQKSKSDSDRPWFDVNQPFYDPTDLFVFAHSKLRGDFNEICRQQYPENQANFNNDYNAYWQACQQFFPKYVSEKTLFLQRQFNRYLYDFHLRDIDVLAIVQDFQVLAPSKDSPEDEITSRTIAAVMLSLKMDDLLHDMSRNYPGIVKVALADLSAYISDIRNNRKSPENRLLAREEDLFSAQLLALNLLDQPNAENYKSYMDFAAKLSGHSNPLMIGLHITMLALSSAMLIWCLVGLMPVIAGTAAFTYTGLIWPISSVFSIVSSSYNLVNKGFAHGLSGKMSHFGKTLWKTDQEQNHQIDLQYWKQPSKMDNLKSGFQGVKNKLGF